MYELICIRPDDGKLLNMRLAWLGRVILQTRIMPRLESLMDIDGFVCMVLSSQGVMFVDVLCFVLKPILSLMSCSFCSLT